MESWLLTWNPNYYDWNAPEDETEAISVLQGHLVHDEPACMTWSCGPNKRIQKGDRLFIMRLGVEPKGLVASGYATSNVYEMPHWDPVKAAAGEWKRYVDICFDKVINSKTEKILPLQMLRVISSSTRWTPICSGMHIQNSVAQALEEVWRVY